MEIWNKVSDKEWVNNVHVYPVGNPDTIIPVGQCRVYASQKKNFAAVEVKEGE